MYTLPQQVVPFFIRIWKDVTYPEVEPGRYIIFNTGEVYDNKLGRYKNLMINYNGYYIISLSVGNGKFKDFLLHRLVAYEFNNPPPDYRNYVVNHIDGNKTNPYSPNLEWITQGENNAHAAKMDLTSHETRANKISKEQAEEACRLMKETDMTYDEIIDTLGLNIKPDTLSSIRQGRSWKKVAEKYDLELIRNLSKPMSPEEVHNICRVLEENKDAVAYRDIARKAGYKEEDIDDRLLQKISNIARGNLFKDISSQYDLSNQKKYNINRHLTDEEVHMLCSAMEKYRGSKQNIEIAQELGFGERSDEVRKLMYDIKKGKYYKEIVSQYDLNY